MQYFVYEFRLVFFFSRFIIYLLLVADSIFNIKITIDAYNDDIYVMNYTDTLHVMKISVNTKKLQNIVRKNLVISK